MRNKSKGKLLTKSEKQQVRQMILGDSEVKMKDFDILSNSFDTSGNIELMSSITQNVSYNGRVGDRVRLKKFCFRGIITIGDSTNIARVIIFQMKSENTVGPTNSDIIQITGAQAVVSNYNAIAERKSMKFLWDSGPMTLNDIRPQITFKGELKAYGRNYQGKKNMDDQKLLSDVTYDGGSSSTGMNQLYIYYVSDSGGVPNTSMQFSSRLYYYDD